MTLLIIPAMVARCYCNYAEIWGDIRRWCVVNDRLAVVIAVVWWRRGVEREDEEEKPKEAMGWVFGGSEGGGVRRGLMSTDIAISLLMGRKGAAEWAEPSSINNQHRKK